MKTQSGILATLIAGSLAVAPGITDGQVPWKPPALERSTTVNLNMKRYVAAGNRAYVVGVEDGSIPPSGLGWHITGQMGGVWVHPIKLLDHFQFYLNGQLLPPATTFVSGTGYVRQELPAVQNITISETQFAPDGLPVVLIGLQLQSSQPGTTTAQLAIVAQSELIAAYPWSSTTPTSTDLHQQDQVSYDPTLKALQFTQPGQASWYALVSAALDPSDRTSTFQSMEASNLGPAGPNKGATGTLTYQITFSGTRGTTVWFAVAGSNVGEFEAAAALVSGLAAPDVLLNAKISERQKVLARAQIHVPDSTIQDAFDWAKMNLADMRRKVEDVMVRDTGEGTVYPHNPIATIPVLSGFGAGYPDYPWFFGTDGCYTTFALAAVGLWDQAKDHLNTVRQVS